LKFSEREGITKVRTEIQVDNMDEALRNKLWNALDLYYWRACNDYALEHWDDGYPIMPKMRSFLNRLYNSFLKTPVDTIPKNWHKSYSKLRGFYFQGKWYFVYDFIEFIADVYEDEVRNEKFKKTCNEVFEGEMSAYRFVGKQITRITSEEEISEIEEALESPFKNVNIHFENAVKLMSDRKAPDYRNSIKESISAVEAICRVITGKETATLGKALDTIEKEGKIELHGALKEAFDHLYGYTSSADGIRHAFSDEKINADFDEAKFMLVACSAFVNYLKSKMAKAGIKPN
jgi:hypothetical protein